MVWIRCREKRAIEGIFEEMNDPNSHGDIASALLAESAADRFGLVSPSLYETARLVSLAPGLTGHRARIRHLVERQEPAGHWGDLDVYRVVPTLSAAEALLTAVLRDGEITPEIVHAVERALSVLFGWFGGAGLTMPDTVAVELIVPALVADLNAHLDALARHPVTGLPAGERRLILPPGLSSDLLDRVRAHARSGTRLPEKLWHSLEIFGATVQGAAYIQPIHGSVGCSPAATAAWLGDGAGMSTSDTEDALRYLTDVQQRDGAVPVGAPVDLFEQAWLLAQFAEAGVPVRLPEGLTDALHNAFTPQGLPVGAGLIPDVDDTATALYALARSGSPHAPDSLANYRVGRHFACFADERTASSTANAHVLQALGVSGQGTATLAQWLRERQHEDGSWTDKWHASPFYATVCCVTALAEFDDDPAEPVRRAASWVLEHQQPDGSWGRWDGTYEETAYAIQILLNAPIDAEAAVVRGCRFLRAWGRTGHPSLWHDKDLYTPTRVVRAAGLAALHLARTRIRPAAIAEHR